MLTIARTREFATEVNDELKKVTWPDKETTKNLTLVVIAISAVLGALLGGLDWVLQQVFALI